MFLTACLFEPPVLVDCSMFRCTQCAKSFYQVWNASGWGDGAAYDGWKRELGEALAVFWAAERSPGVSESLAEGALGLFYRRRRSSTGRAPAFSSPQSSSTAPCFDEHSEPCHFTKSGMRAIGAMGQLMMAGSASWGRRLLCFGPLSGVLECQGHWQRARWAFFLGAGGLARGELLPFRASSPRRLLHVSMNTVCLVI